MFQKSHLGSLVSRHKENLSLALQILGKHMSRILGQIELKVHIFYK